MALTDTSIPMASGQLYEWDGADESIRLVSALPAGGGEPAGGASLGAGEDEDARNAVAAEGSRVFFGAEGKLYMRDLASESTLRLDLPEPSCATCGRGAAGAAFQFASADGSRVLFTDTQRLTSDAGAKGSERDLYECVITEAHGEPECELSDLTPRSETGTPRRCRVGCSAPAKTAPTSTSSRTACSKTTVCPYPAPCTGLA